MISITLLSVALVWFWDCLPSFCLGVPVLWVNLLGGAEGTVWVCVGGDWWQSGDASVDGRGGGGCGWVESACAYMSLCVDIMCFVGRECAFMCTRTIVIISVAVSALQAIACFVGHGKLLLV